MDEVVPFAQLNYRNQSDRFGIKGEDRLRHMYVIGKTGMGKTTLLENMVIDDIRAGRGLAVVDPHGEFAEKILHFVPKERVKDVIYFNPADLEHPIAFNAIETVAPEYRHLVTDGLVGVFQKLWAESWGPRLEYLLRNAILALLEIPDSTLLGIMRILSDKAYRKWVIAQLKDPVVKAFWRDEFSKYPDRFATEAVAPIQNKVGQFLANPLIRNIVGQPRTAFNPREIMDEGKIFVMNLSKGRLGEGTSHLLGAMMITKFQLGAMSRIDTPEESRKDFYLYVDEFQNFATVSFASILSEARKYHLGLILAHQYIAQLEEPVSDAVFGNVGTQVVFRVGAADAEFLEKEFEPEFMVNDLVNLSKYNIYLNLMIDGVASRPFSATTLVPHHQPDQSFQKDIIEYTRANFGSNRVEIEKAITEWAGPIESPEGIEAVGPSGKQRADRAMHETDCWICGAKTQVPFMPDNVRPIYCEKCLNEIRAGTREPVPARDAGARRDRPSPGQVGGQRRDVQGGHDSGRSPVRLPGQGVDRSPVRLPSGRAGPDRAGGQGPGHGGDERRERRDAQRATTKHEPVLMPIQKTAPVVRESSTEGISLSDLKSEEEHVEQTASHETPHREERRPKVQRPHKERPAPDLSGLREILEDVLEEEKTKE